MAHIAKIGALTDELIALITSMTVISDATQFNVHRESVLRALRQNPYTRTNQFEVTSQLDGLEEKFRVYNEDPLADALRERLNLLHGLEVKWAPEILHLLLELSDRPLANSKLEDLDLLKEPEIDEGPKLTWKDLGKEDPLLREKSIWANVDFGAEDSDTEKFDDSRSEASSATNLTGQSSLEEDPTRRPEDYAVQTLSKEGLETLRNEQFWQKTPTIDGVKLETVRRSISELQAIREVLFMLGGLPSSIFESPTPTEVVPLKTFVLKHASPEAFLKILQSFAQHGSAVLLLRAWIKRSQSIPLLQSFQGCIMKRLRKFDSLLAQIQLRLVKPAYDIVISLLVIQEEIKSHTSFLGLLSGIVKKFDEDPYGHAFRYLELLYDTTCTSQMAGDDATYSSLGNLFFECLQVYLRPIRSWMEDGQLNKEDKVFFIIEALGDVEPASVWDSKFKICCTQGGILHAPRFLQATANKIFNTGKSVVVLKHLKRFDVLQSSRNDVEPILDFNTVCNPTLLQLAPFQELFDTAFDAWIQSKHHQASSLLRRTLFDSCGLHTALDALSHIYFIADGITGSKFTNHIFDKLDTLNSSWNDCFTLTELCRSTIGTLPSVSADRLRMVVLPLHPKHQDLVRCRQSLKALSVLEIKYHLAWPIQTIITPATMPSYRRIFTFLLQIRRSTHILSRQRLIDDTLMQTGIDERALYYSLRMRLLWFNQNLYYYLTALVLEPCTQKMQVDLKAAEDVDAMIQVHSAYLKATIDEALLGSKLELMHRTILKILQLGIKLEDTQATNAAADKEKVEQQREMMDLSMASLGLQTPKRKINMAPHFSKSVRRKQDDSSSDEEEEEINVDLSILSSPYDESSEDMLFVDKLRKLKSEFDRLVHFVVSGLRGVARANSGKEGKSWDILAEMLESGLG